MLKYALALRSIKDLITGREFFRPTGEGHAAEAALDMIMETVSVLDFDCDYLPGAEIPQITNDSRQVTQGAIFVAINGSKSNGMDYVPQALKNGAAVIISENSAEAMLLPGTINLIVKNAYAAYGILCEAFYDFPVCGSCGIAVTGTNGKTTSAFLIRQLLNLADKRCGLISTIEYDCGKTVEAADRTTPEAFRLFSMFDAMRSNGLKNFVMETSSHALHQKRIGSVKFQAAIFTNLTGDHLDYHRSMEEYYQAKKILFTQHLADDGVAIINTDDPYGKRLAEELNNSNVITFGIQDARCKLSGAASTTQGSTFVLQTDDTAQFFSINLSGIYNTYNTAGAVLALHYLNKIPLAESAALLRLNNINVPGRMESFALPNGAAAIVDYAHTQDALSNVLTALRNLEPLHLTVVFGCGGDRDKSKRPLMGKIAAALADKVYLTSDNPRSEKPDVIIKEIQSGIPESFTGLSVEPDRRTAILQALNNARSGDIVLIAGKGHETYQEINGVKFHFDDHEVIRDFLN